MRLATAGLLLVFLFAGSLSGCADEAVVDTEVRRPDDPLSLADLDKLAAVVESLSDQTLPQLPAVLMPAPRWNSNRTLPVRELLAESSKQFTDHEDLQWYARRIPHSASLRRALKRQGLTVEQFAALYIAFGLACARVELPENRDLAQILAEGRRALELLRRDQRTFATLSEDEAWTVQEQSGWLAIVQRCNRLNMPHAQSLELIRQHHERLHRILPAEFTTNPLEEFSRILDDQGVPFRETAGGESDDRLPWLRSESLAGFVPQESDVPALQATPAGEK